MVKRNVFLRSLITFLPDSGLGRETVDGWFVYIFSDLTCRGRCWGEGVGWGRSSSCPCWSPRPPELGCSSCSTSAQSEALEVHLEIDGQAQEESIKCGIADATLPYIIKTQRKARNAPGKGHLVPRAVSLWYKRAGLATPWSQPIRGQYLYVSGPMRGLHSAWAWWQSLGTPPGPWPCPSVRCRSLARARPAR